MRRQVRRWIKLSAGVLLVILGLVGFIAPGLQGILFTIIGLKLLADESEFARKWLRRIKARLPARMQTWINKIQSARGTNDSAG